VVEKKGSYFFETGVIDKGFIRFAASRARRSRRGLIAAKVMKPLGELNPGKLETLEAWKWPLLLGIDQNAPEMLWGVRDGADCHGGAK
jgi:hypothetical protein